MTTDPSESTAAVAECLADLAARYWQLECHERPLSAALAGVPGTDPVLFRESATDHARRDAGAAALLAELQALPTAGLDTQDRATHALLRRDLETIRAQYAARSHWRPWLLPAGPEFNAVYWANSSNVADARDAAFYVERLASVPTLLRDVQRNMEEGIANGIRWPQSVVASAAANAAAHAAAVTAGDIDASPWLGPFRRSAAAGTPALQAEAARARALVQAALLPALQGWAGFLAGLHPQHTQAGLSCLQGPHGEAHYRAWVRHFTTTERSPAEIHALGLAEMDRIAVEIARVAADAGFAGDVPGYRAWLQAEPSFVAPSKEALREQVEVLCKRIDRMIPQYFGRIPRITYGVDSMPEALSERMPAAYAQPSPADGSTAGVFWISGIPSRAPSYLHPALTVHEAWPGHLMHLALVAEQQSLPAFRRYGAVQHTACVEGWALYCERLGEEMGLYRTPHEHYGRLELEMWRALRLVVDTGIHWHGWSREQAVQTMVQHLTLSRASIEAEVDRYAAMPAQALAYQIGGLKLRELRERAQTRLGARFMHRSFHDTITGAGAVTLPVLDDLVEHWLQAQQAQGTQEPQEAQRHAA